MNEQHPIEHDLKVRAELISAEYEGAPVVVIVGGDSRANVPRVMTASCIEQGRLRDLLGILETSIQIESLKHFGIFPRAP